MVVENPIEDVEHFELLEFGRFFHEGEEALEEVDFFQHHASFDSVI